MPAHDFTVHVDADELVQRDLAAVLARAVTSAGAAAARPEATALDAAHHGARDGRQAARRRSERDHADRASSSAGNRSYVFRRS
jgi:ribosomal protein L12E/L44/L45/RPP1/RPP2